MLCASYLDVIWPCILISNGNRTERSPIRSVIIRVINKIREKKLDRAKPIKDLSSLKQKSVFETEGFRNSNIKEYLVKTRNQMKSAHACSARELCYWTPCYWTLCYSTL